LADGRRLIPYREIDHGNFEQEWLPHRRVSDWWYLTGYLEDAGSPGAIYSYQFTVFNPKYLQKVVYAMHTAFTDMQTQKHHFEHSLKFSVNNRGIRTDGISVFPSCRLEKTKGAMRLAENMKEINIDLTLQEGKGAFWHGENGVLAMGQPDDPIQRTVYYSCPNMPTSGTVDFKNSYGLKRIAVTGKSWFDRQWGPFRMLHSASYWEWFSLRFFDDEEVMLFAFPMKEYYDGTYIDRYGKTTRIMDYHYSYHRLKRNGKLQFSFGWDITLPGIKEEHYRILPVNGNQYNSRYYEIMARITGMNGKEVGYCFVELLPGVRQEGRKYNFAKLVFPE
jgi:predicted secreted hydrolase